MLLSRRIRARDYMFKTLHNPNKFKTKYARRKGFNYDQNFAHNTEDLSWRADESIESDVGSNVFPFNIGHDSKRGPIRHRDFRSNYVDLNENVPVQWWEDAKSKEKVQMTSNYRKNLDEFYKRNYAAVGPAIPEEVFPFRVGDQVEFVGVFEETDSDSDSEIEIINPSIGQRGTITFIHHPHNYILVEGVNKDVRGDYSKDHVERAVLPDHIRLINPNHLQKLKEYENRQKAVDNNEPGAEPLTIKEEYEFIHSKGQIIDRIAYCIEFNEDEEGAMIDSEVVRYGLVRDEGEAVVGEQRYQKSIEDDDDDLYDFDEEEEDEEEENHQATTKEPEKIQHFDLNKIFISDSDLENPPAGYAWIPIPIPRKENQQVNQGNKLNVALKHFADGDSDQSVEDFMQKDGSEMVQQFSKELKKMNGQNKKASPDLVLSFEEKLKEHYGIEQEKGRKTYWY